MSKNQTKFGVDAPKPWETDSETDFVPLTAEQAHAWRAQHGQGLTAWSVVRMQLIAALFVGALTGLLTHQASYVWSAVYGALAIALPNAAMARGISRRKAPNAETAVAAVLVWEMVKVAASATMLMVAPRMIENLSWPALLLGLVLTLKVNWLALALRGQNSRSIAKSRTE